MPAVTFKEVGFSYDGTRLALDTISADFEKGSFTCILGGNGSGKSTLAKLINALLLPDEGTVSVFDHKTNDPDNLFFVRSNAGMVFQNPDDQIVASVVEDDVAFGPENLGVPQDELTTRVLAALDQVGLSGFAKQDTYALSGGQKQRVAIAGVLAIQPRILILDEAGAMLDPRGQQELFKVCHELHQNGFTIIFITHSMDEAAFADRVILMDAGHIAKDAEPADTLSDISYLQRLNLDVPFAAKMSNLLQERGIDVPSCITEDDLVCALKSLCCCIPKEDTPLSGKNEINSSSKEPKPQLTVEEETNELPLLSFENVSFTYVPKSVQKYAKTIPERSSSHDSSDKWGNNSNQMWALKDIDLTIYKSDFFGIAGHTGSGKSTLLQLANGILQPTRGRVLVKGADLSHKKEIREAHQYIGLVFQYPERQLFATTVFDDVAFGPRNLGLSEDEVKIRVEEALELMRLDVQQIRDRSPFALSGGQQRRVAIAGILAMNPEVLILDEPAAGLDPHSHEHLIALIAKLHSDQGKTIIMVSHNMDDLAYHCNRIALLNKGQLFAQGQPCDVFKQADALSRIGLALPQTLHLMEQLDLAPLRTDSWNETHRIPTPAELADSIAYQLKQPHQSE